MKYANYYVNYMVYESLLGKNLFVGKVSLVFIKYSPLLMGGITSDLVQVLLICNLPIHSYIEWMFLWISGMWSECQKYLKSLEASEHFI